MCSCSSRYEFLSYSQSWFSEPSVSTLSTSVFPWDDGKSRSPASSAGHISFGSKIRASCLGIVRRRKMSTEATARVGAEVAAYSVNQINKSKIFKTDITRVPYSSTKRMTISGKLAAGRLNTFYSFSFIDQFSPVCQWPLAWSRIQELHVQLYVPRQLSGDVPGNCRTARGMVLLSHCRDRQEIFKVVVCPR